MAKADKTPKKSEEAPPASTRSRDSQETPTPAKGGASFKQLIIIAVIALVMGGGGAVLAIKFLSPPAAVDGAAGSVGSATPESVTSATAEESEEPIIAPTKSGSHEAAAAPAAGGQGEGTAEEGPQLGPITVKLDPFTTNLNEASGRRFLKVTLAMEVENTEASDELNSVMPDIQDSVLILLSSLSSEDISTVDGKERLRSQIRNRANNFMKKYKVQRVKYLEFIIQ
jgi:flagellar FliL protein